MARFKRYRLLMVHIAGRMNRNNCVMGLRLCASAETIARMCAVWEVFELPTQATSALSLARAGKCAERAQHSYSPAPSRLW